MTNTPEELSYGCSDCTSIDICRDQGPRCMLSFSISTSHFYSSPIHKERLYSWLLAAGWVYEEQDDIWVSPQEQWHPDITWGSNAS